MLAARLKNILFSLLAVEAITSTVMLVVCCAAVYRDSDEYGAAVLKPLFCLFALYCVLQLNFQFLFHQTLARFASFNRSISWAGFRAAQLAILLWGGLFLVMDLLYAGGELAGLLLAFMAGSMALILAAHVAVTTLLRRSYNHPDNRLRIVLVGMNRRTREFCRILKATPHLGAEIIGCLDDDAGVFGSAAGVARLGGPADLAGVLRREVVDIVFVFLPVRSYYDAIKKAIEDCGFYGVTAHVVGKVFTPKGVKDRPLTVDDFGSLAFTSTTSDFVGLSLKRVLDVAMAAAGIIVLSPVLAAAGLFIKITSGGPVFFRQDRVGLNKRLFKMVKFRTMVPGAEKQLDKLAHLNEMDGPAFKIANDPRLIPGGAFLRRHSLDELPQLWNVLVGDMSVVGPRPLSKRDFTLITEDWQTKRFSMRPGMTCIWQVGGRNNVSFTQWMRMDLDYIESWKLSLDFMLILKTVRAVVVGSGR